jgi:hypothetical protein
MKKIVSILSVIGLTACAFGADVVRNPGNYPIISSANGGATLANQIWPTSIAASTYVTNVTAIAVNGGKDLALQFIASATTTNGGTVNFQIGRSVAPVAITNSVATGAAIEWVGTVSLVLPANTATSAATVTTNFYSATANTLGGGYPYAYIGYIQTPANVTLTNYSVYANAK